jgi:diaminohydroxyphosphoribosylaminopyrimidine deaminase / 5-amino-6-(5-phosphoribosylamino)uracil reductase
MMKDTDREYMQHALRIAVRAAGLTSPNPLVGAVIVKNRTVVASDFHHKAGFSHAEVLALEKAGARARGATLYVNLEPCVHFGRTPPCAHRIIASGIRRVVVGMLDPNPLNNNKGVRLLKRHGIAVTTGVLEEQCRQVNLFFIKYITTGLPFVTVKVGQSLDGRIATSRFASQWITSEKTRAYSHSLRRRYDAILVGVNTVIKDDPLLAARDKTSLRPLRIIIDSNLRIPLDARVLSSEAAGAVVIACIGSRLRQTEGLQEKIAHLRSRGVTILALKEKDGKVDLKQLMRKLAQMEVANLLVEGGGEAIGSFFDARLVDRVMFFMAPVIIGGKNAVSSVEGRGRDLMYQAAKIGAIRLKRIGDDFLFEGDVIQ